MATQTGLSVEEYLAGDWPANSQLIDGEVVVSDPTFKHQEIAARIYDALRACVGTDRQRGRVGWGGNWTVAERQVFKPDVWWTPPAALPGDGIRSDIPPTIAVEVWSPGTWHIDRGRKREVYEQVGVAELWLVEKPKSLVHVLRRSDEAAPRFDVSLSLGERDTLDSPLLDAFELPVGGLFTD
jgi:Uma2 family endonuclease